VKYSKEQIIVFAKRNNAFTKKYQKDIRETQNRWLGSEIFSQHLIGKELSMGEAAEVLGVTRKTARAIILRWADKGDYIIERRGNTSVVLMTDVRLARAYAAAAAMMDDIIDCVRTIEAVGMASAGGESSSTK